MKNFITLALLCLALGTKAQITQPMEIIAKINPPSPDPSGIAVSSTGRVFLGFPRHADNHSSFALAELKSGKLSPYGSHDFIYPSTFPVNNRLVSPHGMWIDKDDVLWIIDDGKLAGDKEIKPGAAKVVGIDINTNKIVCKCIIAPNAMDSESHLNDLRVVNIPGKGRYAIVTNSGFGKHYSLVVVNLSSGESREVLKNSQFTSPDAGFMAFLEGEPRLMDSKTKSLPHGGADGIALSADGQRVYWACISGRNLYSLPVALLTNPSISDNELEKAVTTEGQAPATDGIAEDEAGNLYFGAFEQQSVVKRNPAGEFTLVAHDKNMVWPDGVAYRNGYVYVTMGQWNRIKDFNNGKDLRVPHFTVYKIKAQ